MQCTPGVGWTLNHGAFNEPPLSEICNVLIYWGTGMSTLDRVPFLGTGFRFFGNRDLIFWEQGFSVGTGIFSGFGGSGTGYLGSEVK